MQYTMVICFSFIRSFSLWLFSLPLFSTFFSCFFVYICSFCIFTLSRRSSSPFFFRCSLTLSLTHTHISLSFSISLFLLLCFLHTLFSSFFFSPFYSFSIFTHSPPFFFLFFTFSVFSFFSSFSLFFIFLFFPSPLFLFFYFLSLSHTHTDTYLFLHLFSSFILFPHSLFHFLFLLYILFFSIFTHSPPLFSFFPLTLLFFFLFFSLFIFSVFLFCFSPFLLSSFILSSMMIKKKIHFPFSLCPLSVFFLFSLSPGSFSFSIFLSYHLLGLFFLFLFLLFFLPSFSPLWWLKNKIFSVFTLSPLLSFLFFSSSGSFFFYFFPLFTFSAFSFCFSLLFHLPLSSVLLSSLFLHFFWCCKELILF